MLPANPRGIKAHANGPQTSAAGIPVSSELNSSTCPTFQAPTKGSYSFPEQILHVYETLVPQVGKINGITDTPPVALTNFSLGRDETFSFQRVDVSVDLPVIHADSLGDVSRCITAGLLGQIPDDSCPKSVGVENTQRISNLWRQSGERLVDAGHTIILAYLRGQSNLHHFLSDASIIFKVLLPEFSAHVGIKGDQP